MYVRQANRYNRGITIPQNYSGSAFDSPLLTEEEAEPQEEVTESEAQSETDAANLDHGDKPSQSAKSFLPINIGSEELILIGVMLLISQSDSGDGIIPILLAILFLGGQGH